MQPEKTGAHADAELAAKAPRHAQHAAFAVEIQSVAGFDFQRGHAVGKQRPCTRHRLREQLLLAGRAGRVDAGDDAATGARDLLVTGAVEAQVEFVRTIAAEHQMGMAVDQPRRDQRTVERFDRVGQRIRSIRQRIHATDPGDAAVMQRDRAMLDQAIRHVADKRRQRGVQQQSIPAWLAHVSVTP